MYPDQEHHTLCFLNIYRQLPQMKILVFKRSLGSGNRTWFHIIKFMIELVLKSHFLQRFLYWVLTLSYFPLTRGKRGE